MKKYTHKDRIERSEAIKTLAISGDIVKELLGGATIIDQEFDGFNWHILLRRTKSQKEATTWEFAIYETVWDTDNMRFHLMTQMNYSLRTAKKEFYKGYWEQRGTIYRICEVNKDKEQ